MNVTRYKPNKAGIRALMKSPEIESAVGAKAGQIAAAANAMRQEPRAYYGYRTKIEKMSAHGFAYTGNYGAMRDNAENDTLDMALGGAR